MILNNLRKSFSGIGKSDSAKIPIPVSGDSGSGDSSSFDNNLWRYRYSSYYSFQNSFLNRSYYVQTSNANVNVVSSYQYVADAPSQTAYGYFIDVGFGDTAESADDYKLADSNRERTSATRLLTHISGKAYTGRSDAQLMPDDDGDCILRVESVYQNDSASDNVTVKEIALCVKPGRCYNSNYNTTLPDWKPATYLIARKVLSTPIVIAPGETYKFTYKLKM